MYSDSGVFSEGLPSRRASNLNENNEESNISQEKKSELEFEESDGESTLKSDSEEDYKEKDFEENDEQIVRYDPGDDEDLDLLSVIAEETLIEEETAVEKEPRRTNDEHNEILVIMSNEESKDIIDVNVST